LVAERPQGRRFAALKTETLAVLFADISRSTQLYDSLGDTVALQTIGRCISSLAQVITENSGTVIKTIGDEIMGTFPGVDGAVLAAAGIQEAVAAEFPEESNHLLFRIGLHFGETVKKEGDVFGDTVNVAARLVKLANPGQILTSEATVQSLATDLSSRVRLLGTFPIKGKQEMLKVYEILLSETHKDPELTLAPEHSPTLEMPQVYLLLQHHDKEILLHESGDIIQMGRDPAHKLVINDKMASRNHAQVEYSHGRFVLTDSSTNGTFVLTNEGETIHLHRDDLRLQGNGKINFGRDFSADAPDVVEYFLHKMES